MVKKILRRIALLLSKQYTSIGGQAVIEGVMMRSPNAFVIAVRKPDGTIRLRRDQWFGLGKKFDVFKKPFLRGVLILIETMANGIVSLNYSANISMEEEIKKDQLKKGKSLEQIEADMKKKEKIDLSTMLTIGVSFLSGIGLFVFLPHALTALVANLFGVTWDLNSFEFHAVDGIIKACIFLLYIWLISFLPDIRRVFQYHGAEHKSIATFEEGLDLTVENARKFSTLHPRCGTTFIFFLIFISIILFSIVFTLFKIGPDWQPITIMGKESINGFQFIEGLRHIAAIGFKILLTFPIAGIAYELIKFSGKHSSNMVCKVISFPGLMLQKLTTKEPDDQQLEVALASIKAVLDLEEKYNLKDAKQKVLTKEEVDIKGLDDLSSSNFALKDFLE